MRKITALCLLLLSFQLSVQSQNTDYQHYKFGAIQGDVLTCDRNGNLYLINDAVLLKIDQTGTILGTYNNSYLGTITSIDVSNPLKIMVFYQYSGMIVFLDDKLVALQDALDLSTRNFFNISLAAFSTDNRIWLYDNLKEELITVDFQLRELQRNRLTINNLAPTQLIALKEQRVVMQNPETGILFFDNFGTYLKTIAIQTELPIHVDQENIYYLNQNQYIAYNYRKLSSLTICSLPDAVKQAITIRNKIFYLDKDRCLNFDMIK